MTTSPDGPVVQLPVVQLPGGLAGGGRVVRIGDTVRRPPRPSDDAATALLTHLRAAGFTGVPAPLGRDEQGRTVHAWVDGEAAHPPYPPHVADDETLASVGLLLAGFHAAQAGYDAPADAVWDRTLAPPTDDATLRLLERGQPVVAHHDVSLENVVCADDSAGRRRAVCLIDPDFAAPSNTLWDVAIALRHWTPVRDPGDLVGTLAGVDHVRRWHVFCDAYAVDASARSVLVPLVATFLERALSAMTLRAAAGEPTYVKALAAGYDSGVRRSQQWLADNAHRLT